VHMCLCTCNLFLQRWGNEDGGVQLVYKSTCCLAWGVVLDKRKDRGVVCVFSISNAGGSVCGCMCVNTHAHTHLVLVREPRSRVETPGEPEESGWTKTRHINIRIYVQSTHLYVYARRREEILD